MRILHTADWHVGKRLGRYDRGDDYVAVLGEVVAIADAEAVDLVVVAGDLFDRPVPSIDALRLVLETLERLARPGRPVVAIAGNHDSAELLDLLAPLVRGRGIHLVGGLRPPAGGGVLDVETAGGRAVVAAFPFLRHGQAVDFTTEAETWHPTYSDRVARLCAAYAARLDAAAGGAVKLLVGHLTLDGVTLGGHGLPRGERELHLGQAYTAAAAALPAGLAYVALGHIHAPQPLPSSGSPGGSIPGDRVVGEYAGSLLELDFGEAGEEKRVVIVEATPGGPTRRRSVPITAGRRLRRVDGRWEELVGRDELRSAYLDLGIHTLGPDPGLADRARREFPKLVKVRALYARRPGEEAPRRDLPWDAQYRDYYRKTYETEPSAELLAAFREVWGEVLDAPP